jgi:hypothetical protein
MYRLLLRGKGGDGFMNFNLTEAMEILERTPQTVEFYLDCPGAGCSAMKEKEPGMLQK